ncbi:MAG: Uma2 family endonuclease [Gomphosphaeria aponina SAG 52.96 = DSM 107014]|uniref:Uma2 family endonuclease n=1 Tax=Gomphosphaeria aponina SAG 52.96 = DSM 107014 TaxID=1521640 RepID=A0A941JPY6_9CHRO|nr:Uma2 family endonuclease [Gomphosphaeria aponina SAG 52.96 = DSM 107014]
MIAATQTIPKLTLEDFLKLPETKPASEYFNGEIDQKPMPQGEHSILQTRLSRAINQICEAQKVALALTELRCTFGGRSIVPDLAVFEWSRIPKTEKGRIANGFTIHPDWIIEILSPEQSANKVMKKIIFCINQGTQLGWLIDSEDESVMIFQPNKFPEIKSAGEILTGLEIMGDWQLSVDEMFSWLTP